MARPSLLPKSGSFALLAAVAIVTRARGLFIPLFPYDEAHYSALAHKILSGAVPYVGAVDHKPVGIELTYAASFALFGDRMWALRLLTMIVVALTGWLIARTAERVLGDPRGRVAGLIYVLASTWGLPGDVQGVNTELYANAALSLAAFVLAMRPATARAWLAAGALTAVAGIYRYPALLAGAAWAAHAALHPAPARVRLARLACLAGGFAAVAAAYAGTFALLGAWDDFVFWGWRYNATYLSGLSAHDQLEAGARSIAIMAVCWSPLLIWARWRRSIDPAQRSALLRAPAKPGLAIATPWLVAALLAIAPGGRFFLHYFLAALPPLAILVAPALWRPGRRRAAGLALAGAITVASSVAVWGLGWFDPGFERDHACFRAAGEYVRDHSAPDDRVFVWGSSHVYFYAERVMATRFFACYYAIGFTWASPGDPRHVVPRAWDDMMADLERVQPLYIIDSSPARLDDFADHPLTAYPRIAALVARDYAYEATVGSMTIYRRRAKTAWASTTGGTRTSDSSGSSSPYTPRSPR